MDIPITEPTSLMDIVQRSATLEPWGEAENIPWNQPDFSERMLREHLAQGHDLASRRAAKIDAHVAWIHDAVLGGKATRILDLACGPGLYAERLALRGHHVVGIDFSPASVAWAKQRARESEAACEFVEADLRAADFGSGFGLAMLIFGELNIFRPEEARRILAKARDALEPGGTLVLEVHTREAIEQIGLAPRRWSSAPQGLFGDAPYLWLEETQLHRDAVAAVKRHFVIDAESGAVRRYAATFQGYSDAEYLALLGECGFAEVEALPSLTGEPDPEMPDLRVLVGRRAAPQRIGRTSSSVDIISPGRARSSSAAPVLELEGSTRNVLTG